MTRPSAAHISARWLPALLLGLCTVLGWAPCARADWVWKPQTGWVDPNKTPRDTTDLRYEHALVLLTQGQGKSAALQLTRLLKENPDAEWAEECAFSIGEAYFQGGYFKKAAGAFESYLKTYPAGRRADAALRRLLNTGVALSEKKGKHEAAVDALQKVIERGPASDLADDASDAIGDVYFRWGQYEAAVAAYRDLQIRFPDSEWVSAAPFKIGKCYMRAGEGLDINPVAYANARTSFQEYLDSYPNGVHVAEARELVRKAEALQARSEYRLAAFYVRIRKPRSAAIYLNTVVTEFPDTHYADLARELLKRFRRLDVIP